MSYYGYQRPVFVEEDFINEFGQIIKPGEKVIYVTTSWHQSEARVGTYRGVNKSKSDGLITSVRVEVEPDDRFSWTPKYVSLTLLRVYKFIEPTQVDILRA